MSKKEIKFMTKKSVDSFLLAIEVFNKPTISYRLEGCVFFLCNAWELLLKAKLLTDGESITYKDNPNRTISLSDCTKKVLTNDKDPVRINLSVIIGLRNTATHLVIPEYEADYVPFLAFNVRAYAQKLYEYFNISIGDYIQTDFLSLFTVSQSPKKTNILGKYGKNIRNAVKDKKQALECAYNSSNADIALNVQVNLVRVNREELADVKYYRSHDKNDPHATVIEKDVDYNLTHTLTHHKVAEMIDSEIKQKGILFNPINKPIASKNNPSPKIFTTNALDLLLKEYDWKNNKEYCWSTEYGSHGIYKYSSKLVMAIISLIMNNPNVVVDINNRNRKRRKNKS